MTYKYHKTVFLSTGFKYRLNRWLSSPKILKMSLLLIDCILAGLIGFMLALALFYYLSS